MAIKTETPVDELTVLKTKAEKIGIDIPPKATVEILKELIRKTLEEELSSLKEGNQKSKAELRKEALKLVRVVVSCNNPLKKELNGELISIANEVMGRIGRYVPFDEPSGWHIENAIYEYLKKAKCYGTNREAKRGNASKPILINEYTITVLEPLTKKELEELAIQQATAEGKLV